MSLTWSPRSTAVPSRLFPGSRLGRLTPARDEGHLIASITSTNIRKLVFLTSSIELVISNPNLVRYYEVIDDRLCQLVERLRRSGYQHRLEVEYQTCESPQDDVEPDFSRSLLKFREQGLVKIVETDGRVIYCSDEHGVQV